MNDLATDEVVEQTSTGNDDLPFADLGPDENDTSDETAEEQASPEATAEAEAEAPEAYQLPDEQSKVFTEQAIQQYAQARYPKYAALLSDANTPEPTREAVRQIMHDALNKDIYIEKLRAEEQETEEEDQEAAAEPTPANPEAWDKAVTSFVDKVSDEKSDLAWFNQINAALREKDPAKQASMFAKTLRVGMANFARDLLPAILFGAEGQPGQIDHYIESRYEGLGQMHANSSRAIAWDEVRDSNPAYANLPEYGTPEFVALAQKAAAMVPGIENARFTDEKGNLLSPAQQFRKKSELLAKLVGGTATSKTVAEASKAVETGKKLAVESVRRKQSGNLGAGQTKGQITPGNLSDLDKARKEAIARTRSEEANPFGAPVEWK